MRYGMVHYGVGRSNSMVEWVSDDGVQYEWVMNGRLHSWGLIRELKNMIKNFIAISVNFSEVLLVCGHVSMHYAWFSSSPRCLASTRWEVSWYDRPSPWTTATSKHALHPTHSNFEEPGPMKRRLGFSCQWNVKFPVQIPLSRFLESWSENWLMALLRRWKLSWTDPCLGRLT